MSRLKGFVIMFAFLATNASFFTSASELDPMAENQDYAPFEGRWGNFEDELTSSPATDNETNDAGNDSESSQIGLGSSEEITLLCNTTNTKGWSARNHSYCSGRVTVPNPPPASVSLTLLGLDSTEFEGIKVKLGTTELSSVDQIKNTFTGAVVGNHLSKQKQLLAISFDTKNQLQIVPDITITIIWGSGNSSKQGDQVDLIQESELMDKRKEELLQLKKGNERKKALLVDQIENKRKEALRTEQKENKHNDNRAEEPLKIQHERERKETERLPHIQESKHDNPSDAEQPNNQQEAISGQPLTGIHNSPIEPTNSKGIENAQYRNSLAGWNFGSKFGILILVILVIVIIFVLVDYLTNNGANLKKFLALFGGAALTATAMTTASQSGPVVEPTIAT
eukprot:936333_1